MSWAQSAAHPERKDLTVWQVFQAERPALVAMTEPFDGFHETTLSASKTCLIHFDRNRYSVAAVAAGKPVQVRAYADRIVVWCNGQKVGEHRRVFGRDSTIYNPLHYVPILARKPGALRNGAPFREWELPPALTQVKARLGHSNDADRQFVAILGAILTDGLDAVEAACHDALKDGPCGRDVILNILARRHDLARPAPVAVPAALTLTLEPAADCARYDGLRKAHEVGHGAD